MRTQRTMWMYVTALTLTVGCDEGPDALDLADLADLSDDELADLADLAADEPAAADGELPPALGDLAAAADDPAGLTCFFCPPPPAPTGPPKVINPYVSVNAQGNAILFMAAAASFIVVPGATATLQVPFSTQTFGPFALSFDTSGTQLRTNVTGAFPAGTCRIITVTNPDSAASSPVSLCR